MNIKKPSLENINNQKKKLTFGLKQKNISHILQARKEDILLHGINIDSIDHSMLISEND